VGERARVRGKRSGVVVRTKIPDVVPHTVSPPGLGEEVFLRPAVD
jgi:hypothetical protein